MSLCKICTKEYLRLKIKTWIFLESIHLDIERKKLEKTPYFDSVDNSLSKDPKNGYDILSCDENGHRIYI